MKLSKPLIALVFVVGTVAACSAPVTEPGLLEELIKVINTKDEPTVEKFIRTRMDSSVPVADRLKGVMRIADRGAPFTLKRVISSTGQEIKALVTDGRALEHGLTLSLTSDTPPKLQRLSIGPPEILESKQLAPLPNWKSLTELCNSLRDGAKVPAMGIAVMRERNAESAVAGTRTLKSTAKVGPDETWSIGSIGKSLCTTVIGKLIEAGQLQWDSRIGDVLKNLPMKQEYRNVTIEQLMQHRGGIPTDLMMMEPDVRRIIGSESNPSKIRLNYAKDLLLRAPTSQPGSVFAYSNGGFIVLGAIAETVTGEQYESLVKRIIFNPLGLRNSFTNADTLPSSRPSGHMLTPNGLEEMSPPAELEIMTAAAGGGMYMSLGDLVKFGRAHLDGLQGKDGLLKAATIQRLHKGISEGTGRSYGCGWSIENLPGAGVMHGHNGSNGTMEAQLSIFPEQNLVVAAAVNAGVRTRPSPPLSAVLAVAGRRQG